MSWKENKYYDLESFFLFKNFIKSVKFCHCFCSFFILFTGFPLKLNKKEIKDKQQCTQWYYHCHLFITYYYYTSDSLWKIGLVENIQSIHNSLWTWHDKCNICCRYCIYHVKFNVCLVTKPLGVFSSETEWLNVFFCLLFKKCIIKQLLNSVFAWYHEKLLSKPRVSIICLSLRLQQITQTSVLIINDIMLNLIQ